LAVNLEDIIAEFSPKSESEKAAEKMKKENDVPEIENPEVVPERVLETSQEILKIINTGQIKLEEKIEEKPVRADSFFDTLPLPGGTLGVKNYTDRFPNVRYKTDTADFDEEISNSGKIKISIAQKIKERTSEIAKVLRRPQDADNLPYISENIKKNLTKCTAKMYQTLVIAVISCYISFASIIDLPILKILKKDAAFNYAGVQLILGLVVFAFTFELIIDGLKSLFTLRANYNTLPAFSLIAGIAAALFFTVHPKYLAESELFMPIALLAVFFALFARYKILKNAVSSIKILMEDNPKHTLDIIKDEDVAVKLGKAGSIITLKNESKYLKDVEKSLINTDIAGKYYSIFAPILLVISIAAAIICVEFQPYKLTQYEVMSQLFVNIPLLLLSVTAVASAVIFYSPMDKAAKVLNTHGSIFNHFGLVEKLSETNTLLVDFKEIMPYNLVNVGKLNLTEEGKKEETIPYLTSLIMWSDSILSVHFLQLLKNEYPDDYKKYVYRISQFENVGEGGFRGSIKGKTLYFGNREYMELNRIYNMPTTLDVDETVGDVDSILYFAIGTRVVAFFGVDYNVDGTTKHYVQRITRPMKNNRVSLRVFSKDCNITQNLLSRIFEVDEDAFSIISTTYFGEYEKQTAVREVSSAYMVTDGKFSSVAETILQSRKIGNNINIAASIQAFLSIVILAFCFICILFEQSVNPLLLFGLNIIQGILLLFAVNWKNKSG
jgi:hypothetical protein